MKSLDRLQRHHLIRPDADDVLGVAVTVPPLADRWLTQIPDTARAAHHLFLQAMPLDRRGASRPDARPESPNPRRGHDAPS